MKRAWIAVMALAGIVVTALPSEFVPGQVWQYAEWPWRWTLVIGNIAAFGAGALSLMLAWKSEHDGAPHLAVSLALAVLAFGLGTHPALPVTATVLSASTLATTILALGGFVRFTSVYPRPVTTVLIEDALESSDARLPMDEATARVGQWFRDRLRGPLDGVVRPLAAARRRMLARLEESMPAELTAEGRWDAFRERVLEALVSNAWRYAAIAAVGSGAAMLAGLTDVGTIVLVALVIPSVLIPWILLRISFALGTDEDRRRVLWIGQGFTLLLMIPSLVSWSFIVLLALNSPAMLLAAQLLPPAVALGALALVLCLAVAIFRAGALDPTRTLRSTVVYGALGMVLTLVFAGMEEVASDYLVAWVGLPGDYALWLSTGVTALVFSTLHRRFERAASGLFGGEDRDDSPPSEDALQPSPPTS